MGQSVSSLYEYNDQERYGRLIDIADYTSYRSLFHILDAEQTSEFLSSFNDPEYIKKAAKKTDEQGRTPLHTANAEKTKTIMEFIPKKERASLVKSLLDKKSEDGLTILDNDGQYGQDDYEEKTKTLLAHVPLGANITSNVQRINALNSPDIFKDYIATAQDLSDLFMGVPASQVN